MLDPYRTLGVTRTADDNVIRIAWSGLIRQYPPERDPHRFKQIQQAFEILKNRHRRLEFELFNTDAPESDDLLNLALLRGEVKKPDAETLRQCLKRSMLLAKVALPSSDD